MSRQVPVSVVMSRSVYTLDVASKLSAVRRALIANDFHHMPIVDGDVLVGMVSWRDLVRAYREASRSGEGTTLGVDDVLDRSASVEDVMTRDLVTVRDDDSLDRAIDRIADDHIHSVLVLDAEEELVGIITDKNIIEYLAN